jgi:hypothetical protein
MRVFLSHAQKDVGLASRLAELLEKKGLQVWNSAKEITPGDNWAKKIGKALDAAELMVILLTPGSAKSDWLRQEINYALGSEKLAHRVYTVFVGPTLEVGKDIPWILLKLPNCQIGSPDDFGDAVAEIQALSEKANLSHSNA